VLNVAPEPKAVTGIIPETTSASRKTKVTALPPGHRQHEEGHLGPRQCFSCQLGVFRDAVRAPRTRRTGPTMTRQAELCQRRGSSFPIAASSARSGDHPTYQRVGLSAAACVWLAILQRRGGGPAVDGQ
jgi:hypothetical protein